MIGLEIEKKIDTKKIKLLNLLNSLNLTKYNWNVVEKEIILNKKNIDLETVIDVDVLKNIISNELYFIYFLNIRAYPKNKKISGIKNYSDFLKSDCEIIILISDGNFIEIYSKNQETLENVKKIAKTNKYNVHEKTIKNDGRTKLYVWWKYKILKS